MNSVINIMKRMVRDDSGVALTRKIENALDGSKPSPKRSSWEQTSIDGGGLCPSMTLSGSFGSVRVHISARGRRGAGSGNG